MISFEEYKKIACEQKDAELFKQYEDYRKEWLAEEQKTVDAKVAGREKVSAARFEFLKYFFGTIIIGGFTAYTTFIFKDYELKLQTRKQDSETIAPYMNKFMDLMEKDSLKYNRVHAMCEFLSYTIIEDSLKNGFVTLRNLYQSRINDAIKNVNVADDQIRLLTAKQDSLSHIADSNISNVDKAKIAVQISQLQTQQKVLATRKTEAIAVAKDKLENITNLDIPVSSDPANYDVIYEEDRFTGPGWFSQAIEGFSVFVNEIDMADDKIKFELKKGEELIAETTQTKSDVQPIFTKDHQYKITIYFTSLTKHKAYYTIRIEKKKEISPLDARK